VVATAELTGALSLAVMAFLLPLAALVLAVVIMIVLIRRGRARRASAESKPG
jgi:hypothetical protein